MSRVLRTALRLCPWRRKVLSHCVSRGHERRFLASGRGIIYLEVFLCRKAIHRHCIFREEQRKLRNLIIPLLFLWLIMLFWELPAEGFMLYRNPSAFSLTYPVVFVNIGIGNHIICIFLCLRPGFACLILKNRQRDCWFSGIPLLWSSRFSILREYQSKYLMLPGFQRAQKYWIQYLNRLWTRILKFSVLIKHLAFAESVFFPPCPANTDSSCKKRSGGACYISIWTVTE